MELSDLALGILAYFMVGGVFAVFMSMMFTRWKEKDARFRKENRHDNRD